MPLPPFPLQAPAIEPVSPTGTFVAPWNAENIRFAPQEFAQHLGSIMGMGQPAQPSQAPVNPQAIQPLGQGMAIDPEQVKLVKQAGLSNDNSIKRIADAVQAGFMPNTPEFRKAVGVSAEDLGIQPSGAWGGLAGWADGQMGGVSIDKRPCKSNKPQTWWGHIFSKLS